MFHEDEGRLSERSQGLGRIRPRLHGAASAFLNRDRASYSPPACGSGSGAPIQRALYDPSRAEDFPQQAAGRFNSDRFYFAGSAGWPWAPPLSAAPFSLFPADDLFFSADPLSALAGGHGACPVSSISLFEFLVRGLSFPTA